MSFQRPSTTVLQMPLSPCPVCRGRAKMNTHLNICNASSCLLSIRWTTILISFKPWPSTIRQSPEQLAKQT